MSSASEWRLRPIREFAVIGTGGRDTKDRVVGGKYPFFVRSQTIERINTWSFDGEAVLTAGDGVGTGKVFHYINGKFEYHQRVYRISNFHSGVQGKYFFYQFSRNFLSRIESLTAKSSVDSVRMEAIAGMEIAIPTEEEQRLITEALDDVNALCSGLGALAAKKRAIKQGLMQELFSQAASWRPTQLAALADVIDPHPSHRAPPETQNGVPFAGIGDLDTRGNLIGSPRLVAPSVLTEHAARYAFADGLLGLGRVASIGKVVQFSRGSRMAISPTMGVIRPRSVSLWFLYYALQMPMVTDQFASITSGSTRSSIGMESLRRLAIAMPDEGQATRIGEILVDIDSELNVLERRLEASRRIREGMMQELLAGRTRLVVRYDKE